MRQSSAYAARPSHAGSLASQASNAALNLKLLEKKKELDALSALERASEEYVKRMEALGLDCETMANAGRVHGDVLAQWPTMFRILGLYLSGRTEPQADNADEEENAPPAGERLVRVPIESLQQAQPEPAAKS
ncbi:hypothetical protein BD410DRAFT_898166 [Rickenella mellea]|uniref:DASH complex subunit DAD2 n=1 Tax=Rickenella mellea TaxID=50990 RepID=A0A4Y7Q4L0_9AGAM|nr:hypothetical protein BD410DRAFT_898166 [Rickenella mellea]